MAGGRPRGRLGGEEAGGTLDRMAYLRRIGYPGSTEPTLETLRGLHVAHLQTVPFENLDIALGRLLLLDPGALFSKIVERRRGGYCYELNGLFALLLRELGFDVDLLSARVPNAAGEFGPDFDHMALRVRLEEPWLADVGFGELFLRPLRLGTPDGQPDDGKVFRITQDGDARILGMGRRAEPEKPRYRFTLRPRELEDFGPMNVWQQTSPDSHFTKNSVCTRVTPEGRITLSGSRLITTTDRERTERVLTASERIAILRESFGIVLENSGDGRDRRP